jgi:predicted N-acetyltransferase YhbS
MIEYKFRDFIVSRSNISPARRAGLEIRPSMESDLETVLQINERAFGEDEGAEIVALIKALFDDPSAVPLLSLLAIKDDEAVGHILFSKAHISSSSGPLSAVILAPLAVLPEAQSQGIGGQLIREGLRRLLESGVDLVFVLGDPAYFSDRLQPGMFVANSIGHAVLFTAIYLFCAPALRGACRGGLFGATIGLLVSFSGLVSLVRTSIGMDSSFGGSDFFSHHISDLDHDNLDFGSLGSSWNGGSLGELSIFD